MIADYVILGGGDFAVELATYLSDIRRLAPETTGRITDVVAAGRVRLDDLSAVLGERPMLYETPAVVPSLTTKLCVIAVGDPLLRQKFMHQVLATGGQLGTVIHPTAYIAASASLGAGSIICPLAFVGPFSRLGKNCVVNTQAVVGHDVVLGDCVVLSPGADVNGYGRVGECGFLGAGAIISPKAALGAYSKLSAGSVLNRSTDEGFLMHGNPATGRQMFRRAQSSL